MHFKFKIHLIRSKSLGQQVIHINACHLVAALVATYIATYGYIIIHCQKLVVTLNTIEVRGSSFKNIN